MFVPGEQSKNQKQSNSNQCLPLRYFSLLLIQAPRDRINNSFAYRPCPNQRSFELEAPPPKATFQLPNLCTTLVYLNLQLDSSGSFFRAEAPQPLKSYPSTTLPSWETHGNRHRIASRPESDTTPLEVSTALWSFWRT